MTVICERCLRTQHDEWRCCSSLSAYHMECLPTTCFIPPMAGCLVLL